MKTAGKYADILYRFGYLDVQVTWVIECDASTCGIPVKLARYKWVWHLYHSN